MYDTVTIVDGKLIEFVQIEVVLVVLQDLLRGLTELQALFEVITQILVELLREERGDHLGVSKRGLVVIGRLHIEWNDRTHPALAMDDVGHPTQFLHRLQHATCEEDSAFTIVSIVFALLIFLHQALAEVVVVVDEIHLHLCRLYRGDLDDQRVVGVIDDQIHARQAYHFVQLSTALIDDAPFGHERADLVAALLNGLRQFPAHD